MQESELPDPDQLGGQRPAAQRGGGERRGGPGYRTIPNRSQAIPTTFAIWIVPKDRLSLAPLR